MEETAELLEVFKKDFPFVEQQLFADSTITRAEFTELLRRLAKEGVSIRDLKLICESIIEFSAIWPENEDRQQWLFDLQKEVRKKLSRTLVNGVTENNGVLKTFILAPEIEREFQDSKVDFVDSRAILEPSFAIALRKSSMQTFAPVWEKSSKPIVVSVSYTHLTLPTICSV